MAFHHENEGNDTDLFVCERTLVLNTLVQEEITIYESAVFLYCKKFGGKTHLAELQIVPSAPRLHVISASSSPRERERETTNQYTKFIFKRAIARYAYIHIALSTAFTFLYIINQPP